MRAIICGGRGFKDRDWAFERLDKVHARVPITHVIEGGQRTRDPVTHQIVGGGDYIAYQWAQARGLTIDTVPADWHALGKRAGYVRNHKMLTEYAPDLVISMPGGPGTAMMYALAKQAGLPRVKLEKVQ